MRCVHSPRLRQWPQNYALDVAFGLVVSKVGGLISALMGGLSCIYYQLLSCVTIWGSAALSHGSWVARGVQHNPLGEWLLLNMGGLWCPGSGLEWRMMGVLWTALPVVCHWRLPCSVPRSLVCRILRAIALWLLLSSLAILGMKFTEPQKSGWCDFTKSVSCKFGFAALSDTQYINQAHSMVPCVSIFTTLLYCT